MLGRRRGPKGVADRIWEEVAVAQSIGGSTNQVLPRHLQFSLFYFSSSGGSQND